MNYIITAKPTQLPIYPERPLARPVASASHSAGEFHDASKRAPSTYVYRGEVLDSITNDTRYRPRLNLQIDPANRRAIESYNRVATDPVRMGQILDGFI
ncbi:MAG: hypothetical protein GY935_13735 [Gammaproteobacteria bacterium]|nr:hypothetical protein [Gammaproteobacteria bacterium]